MKRLAAFLALVLLAAAAAQAVEVEAGLLYGLRTVNDSRIKEVYGNGTCFMPYLAAQVWNGFGLSLGFETGYSRSGTIGLYQEPTTLKVDGLIIIITYQRRMGIVAPYLSLGLGSFSYKQTIDSPYAFETVDASQAALIIGGGVKVYPIKYVFLNADLKFIPLKVTPLEETVDLGGIRLSIGLGVSFGL